MMANTGEREDGRRLVGRGWDWGHREDAAGHRAIRKSSHQHTPLAEEKRSQEPVRAHTVHKLSRNKQNFVFFN